MSWLKNPKENMQGKSNPLVSQTSIILSLLTIEELSKF